MVRSANVLIQLNFSKTVVEHPQKMSHIGFGNKIPSNATYILKTVDIGLKPQVAIPKCR